MRQREEIKCLCAKKEKQISGRQKTAWIFQVWGSSERAHACKPVSMRHHVDLVEMVRVHEEGLVNSWHLRRPGHEDEKRARMRCAGSR